MVIKNAETLNVRQLKVTKGEIPTIPTIPTRVPSSPLLSHTRRRVRSGRAAGTGEVHRKNEAPEADHSLR